MYCMKGKYFMNEHLKSNNKNNIPTTLRSVKRMRNLKQSKKMKNKISKQFELKQKHPKSGGS